MSQVKISPKTMINPKDVIFFEGDRNYTKIHYATRMEIVPITLKSIEKILESTSFFRVHRKYLINLEYILADDGNEKVTMINNRSLSISRRKISSYKKIMRLKRFKNYEVKRELLFKPLQRNPWQQSYGQGC